MTPEERAAARKRSENPEGYAQWRTDLPAALDALEAAEKRIAELERESSTLRSCVSQDDFEWLKAQKFHWHEAEEIQNALERERNEAREKLAASELVMAQALAVVDKVEHCIACASRYPLCGQCGNASNSRKHAAACEEDWAVNPIKRPCNCWKSRIPTGPDSPLAEAVKSLVVTWMAVWNEGVASSADETAAIRSLLAAAPESWKQAKGRTE